MTKARIPCTVVAKKDRVWRQAGVSGGTTYVLLVQIGDGQTIEANAPHGLYHVTEVGDTVMLLPDRWYRAYPAVRAVR